MNYQTILLLIRAMLTCLDADQAKTLKRWLESQDPGPDPASDMVSNAERRVLLSDIDSAIREITLHAGRNA